eukprot:1161403-Pelagomonas_calceolata.AAC.8
MCPNQARQKSQPQPKSQSHTHTHCCPQVPAPRGGGLPQQPLPQQDTRSGCAADHAGHPQARGHAAWLR